MVLGESMVACTHTVSKKSGMKSILCGSEAIMSKKDRLKCVEAGERCHYPLKVILDEEDIVID